MCSRLPHTSTLAKVASYVLTEIQRSLKPCDFCRLFEILYTRMEVGVRRCLFAVIISHLAWESEQQLLFRNALVISRRTR